MKTEYILKIKLIKNENVTIIRLSADALVDVLETYSALKYGMENEGYKLYAYGVINKER
jgi:hypothetical protein